MAFFKKSRHAKNRHEPFVLPVKVDSTPVDLAKPENRTSGAPHALTASEVAEGFDVPKRPFENIDMKGYVAPESPLEALKRRVAAAADPKPQEAPDNADAMVKVTPKKVADLPKTHQIKEEGSLLKKCMPFITDGGNELPKEKPEYTLESVESIVNLTEKKFAKIFEELDLKSAEVTFDDLSKEPKSREFPDSAQSYLDNAASIEIEEIPFEHAGEKDDAIATISDIDATSDFTKTVPFNAVGGADNFEDISSGTRILDLSSEMFEQEPEDNRINTEDYYDEAKDFVVEDDYASPDDAKRVGVNLIIERRNAFLRLLISIVLAGVLALTLIPSLHNALMATPKAYFITCAAIYFVLAIINFDMFKSIKSLITPRKLPEAGIALSSAAVVVYSLVAAIMGINPFNIVFIGAICLCFKAVALFMRAATRLGNFKIVVSRGDKYGIKFIDDKQTTFAMARNSIEGDVLVASSIKTENIQDFLKNTYSDSAMNGVLGKYIIISAVIALISAIAFGVKLSSFIGALEVFAFCLMFLISPSAFFTEILPLRRAGKKLNRLGAMLTGVNAAKKLDIANALTITSSQLFPDGCISLYDMKILDANEIDETLIDAAAITDAIGSPLKGILNSIAKTRPVEIPVADTIKYEERLGISGWIKDRRIFIGNRTLLEAHGISTPPIEVDRKILRQGYFPVYLASEGRPCALLIVKYSVRKDIALRLQKLSNTGITFLVDSCDPNLTNDMICDYFGLWEDSVRVMGGSGCEKNRIATEPQVDFSTLAAYKGSLSALAEIFISAGKIKKSATVLSVFHIVASLSLLLFLLYNAFMGIISPAANLWFALFMLISFVLYIITYMINRP